MKLAKDKTERIFQEDIAEPIGTELEEAAWNTFDVVNENMANAFRQLSTNKGVDPHGLTMVTHGGSGPMHAASVARKLGINTIICPFAAGVGCSVGLVDAPLLYETMKTNQSTLSNLTSEEIESTFMELQQEAHEVLQRADPQGTDLHIEPSVDMRHVDQGSEITVTLQGEEAFSSAAFAQSFERRYLQLYDREPLEYPIEVINYRIKLYEPMSEGIDQNSHGVQSPQAEPPRELYFGDHGWVEADRYRWERLEPEKNFRGPAVIEADHTTAVIDPASTVTVDSTRDLIIKLE
jgi:N-methylhydantoinase A